MEKGFVPRLSRPLVGAVLAACLFSTPTLTAQPPAGISAPWWSVRLEITAKGGYAVSGGEAPVTGDYVCRVLWEGRLEPDDEDFLLVHLRTEILEWRLRERSGPAGRESVREAPAAPGPAVRMNYVIKDGREVEFFFDLGGISIPLHASPLVVALEMPRSSGRTPGGRGRAYGDFVGRGSCRVVIPETDLEQRSPKRHFSWDWRRERQYVRSGRILTVAQSHAAEADVIVTVH
ncbi:MAG: hypothetical protein WCC00_06705 [Candidatus Aminicenantales bacterium]